MASKKTSQTTDEATPKKRTRKKKEAVETTEFDVECSNGKGDDE